MVRVESRVDWFSPGVSFCFRSIFVVPDMLHLGRLTWNLKMDLWKTIFLYNPLVFRFHVGLFQGVAGQSWAH